MIAGGFKDISIDGKFATSDDLIEVQEVLLGLEELLSDFITEEAAEDMLRSLFPSDSPEGPESCCLRAKKRRRTIGRSLGRQRYALVEEIRSKIDRMKPLLMQILVADGSLDANRLLAKACELNCTRRARALLALGTKPTSEDIVHAIRSPNRRKRDHGDVFRVVAQEMSVSELNAPFYEWRHGSRSDSFSLASQERNHLMHEAAACGAIMCLQVLVDCEASVNIQIDHGVTPLYKAVWRNQPEAVRILLDAGANPRPRLHNKFLHNTLLHYALSGNMARLLLKAGADPNARNKKGSTPLHETSSLEVARALLEGGANPCLRDDKGRLVSRTMWIGGSREQTEEFLDSHYTSLDPL